MTRLAKIVADTSVCDGYANCVFAAPEFFTISGTGAVEVLREDVPPEASDAVAHAIAECPARALQVVEAS